jgi:hypothetical protein
MSDQSTLTINYFQPTKNYFWHWADNGNVIEFANGRTICYREDLIFILNNLRVTDQTTVGTILLLLCACKDNYDSLFEFEGHLRSLGYNKAYNETEHQQAKEIIAYTLNLLNLVNKLPYELRSGMKRITLLQSILEATYEVASASLSSMIKEFSSGTFDDVIFNRLSDYTFGILQADFSPLVTALKETPDISALELKLKTGLSNIPQKAEIALPKPVPNDLMEELANDLKTAGLARLAKKVTAALNIPMHLSGSSDQSIGGVSDISNRGHYDKLLLSELAQDDLLLTARLANNEALFLQREQMPTNANQQWHIVLDATLKMWGMPRIFALAAGLAFKQNVKHDHIAAWALGAKHTYPLDLSNKNGIIEALEKLDPGLSCGQQLRELMLGKAASPKDKFIFITGTHYKNDAQFMQSFAQVKDKIDYLVEVSREGNISLYATRGKQHKLINKALIDLHATLLRSNTSHQQKNILKGLPAMLSQIAWPLLFPSSKIKIKNEVVYKFGTSVALLTLDRRLLCWTDKDKGAMEWVDHVEAGECSWGKSTEFLYLLISNSQTNTIKIYQVDLVQQNVIVHTIDDIRPVTVCYHNDMFHAVTLNSVVSIDPCNGTVVSGILNKQDVQQLISTAHFKVLNGIKKMINNGYSVINSVKNIYVNSLGHLFIDQRELKLDQHGRHLSFKANDLNAIEWIKPVKQQVMEVPHLPNIKFTKFSWEEGSEAVMDSRGLLHLKSADESLPEITIILVIEKTIACWCADGKITGSPYFIESSQKDIMLAADFYNLYIQRFINSIKTYATAT